MVSLAPVHPNGCPRALAPVADGEGCIDLISYLCPPVLFWQIHQKICHSVVLRLVGLFGPGPEPCINFHLFYGYIGQLYQVIFSMAGCIHQVPEPGKPVDIKIGIEPPGGCRS